MGKDYSRPLYNFRSPPGFSNFSSKQFPGGVTGSHRTPQGSKMHHTGKAVKVYPRIKSLIRERVLVYKPIFDTYVDDEEHECVQNYEM